MPLNSRDIQRCVDMGGGLSGRVSMLIFAILAPSSDEDGKFWRRAFRKLMPNMRIKPAPLNGFGLSINPLNWSQTVIFEEIFLRNGYDFRKVPFTPEKIIDCGAHIGLFSLSAISYYASAKITAFEPNPKNWEYLNRHVKMNKLNIEIIKAAVSTEAGQMSFCGTNSNSGRLNHGSTIRDGSEVEVVDFPEFVRKLKLTSLLLKMDIEGEELKLLPALVQYLPNQSAIFFETHSGESGWSQISDLLKANEFHVEQLNARGDFYDGFARRG